MEVLMANLVHNQERYAINLTEDEWNDLHSMHIQQQPMTQSNSGSLNIMQNAQTTYNHLYETVDEMEDVHIFLQSQQNISANVTTLKTTALRISKKATDSFDPILTKEHPHIVNRVALAHLIEDGIYNKLMDRVGGDAVLQSQTATDLLEKIEDLREKFASKIATCIYHGGSKWYNWYSGVISENGFENKISSFKKNIFTFWQKHYFTNPDEYTTIYANTHIIPLCENAIDEVYNKNIRR